MGKGKGGIEGFEGVGWPYGLEISRPTPERPYSLVSFGSSRAKNLENSIAPGSLR